MRVSFHAAAKGETGKLIEERDLPLPGQVE
jgi:hypothetical protein